MFSLVIHFVKFNLQFFFTVILLNCLHLMFNYLLNGGKVKKSVLNFLLNSKPVDCKSRT